VYPTCGLDVEKKKFLPLLGLIARSVSLVTVLFMLSHFSILLVSQYGNVKPHLKTLKCQSGIYLFHCNQNGTVACTGSYAVGTGLPCWE